MRQKSGFGRARKQEPLSGGAWLAIVQRFDHQTWYAAAYGLSTVTQGSSSQEVGLVVVQTGGRVVISTRRDLRRQDGGRTSCRVFVAAEPQRAC